MSDWRHDPGACIVCGAAHCACGGGPITIVQLPARDAAALEARRRGPTLPPGPFQPVSIDAQSPRHDRRTHGGPTGLQEL